MSDTELSFTYPNAEAEELAVQQWREYDEQVSKAEKIAARELTRTPIKEIAAVYAPVLLAEKIISVFPGHIQVMNLTIPRERLPLFCIALSMTRMDRDKLPHEQGPRGYTIAPVHLVSGNDAVPGFKISSNVLGEGSILLTCDLVQELLEVIGYFVSTIDISSNQEVE